MRENTIAAVIPLHNKGRFILRAVESVIAQTRAVDEIIVVDDASTDDGPAILQPFLRDERFRLFNRTTPGPGGYAARNVGIREATSRWIAFLDADDTWKPDFIAEVGRIIDTASAGVGCVFTGHEKVWANGRAVQGRASRRAGAGDSRYFNFEDFLSEWLSIGMSPIWTSACVIRRDVLVDIGMFPEARCRLAGDKDTWLRAVAHADAVGSSRPCATYYTVTENQVTRTEGRNHRPCLIGSVETLLEGASGRRRELLLRLLNLEAFERALLIGAHDPVRPEVFRGFKWSLNPLAYLSLLGLAHLPRPLRRILQSAIMKARNAKRRLESAVPGRTISAQD